MFFIGGSTVYTTGTLTNPNSYIAWDLSLFRIIKRQCTSCWLRGIKPTRAAIVWSLYAWSTATLRYYYWIQITAQVADTLFAHLHANSHWKVKLSAMHRISPAWRTWNIITVGCQISIKCKLSHSLEPSFFLLLDYKDTFIVVGGWIKKGYPTQPWWLEYKSTALSTQRADRPDENWFRY